jgi:biopolymer transport protein ExbD
MSRSSLTQISEINLTPMMDLTFILLITFIMTFPLIEEGIAVKLPTSAKTPQPPITAQKSKEVTIDQDGQVYMETVPYDLPQLRHMFQVAARENPDVTIHVRADERVMYKHVVDVLKILKEEKIVNMTLVTQKDG